MQKFTAVVDVRAVLLTVGFFIELVGPRGYAHPDDPDRERQCVRGISPMEGRECVDRFKYP